MDPAEDPGLRAASRELRLRRSRPVAGRPGGKIVGRLLWQERYARDGWAVDSGQYQRATRGGLPDWYLEQPQLARGDEVYLHAFAVLATERARVAGPAGFETGPIPWSRALLYAEKLGFDRRTQFWFANVMLSLDSEYRRLKKEEQDRDRRRQERRERMRARQKAAKR